MVLSGLQQAMMAALKSAAENLPPEIQENILQIGQKVASFQAQLDRIEQQNEIIISILTRKGIENGSIAAGDLVGKTGSPASGGGTHVGVGAGPFGTP